MLITDIWADQPGKFFCISTKSGAGKWKDHFFSRDEFGKIRQFLRDYDDHDIYFCPHGFNRRVRQKSEAVLPNLLWADLDYADPNKMKPKPTVAIESSPGRFVGLWLLKETMTEELNRRLTYHVGADHGGWDLTQVLRFPGTKNFKYKSQPKVRTLWKDGKVWKSKSIEGYLPPEDPENDPEYLSAAEVFELYQGKLPRWVRRELLAKKITGRADRSEMLWKLENACVEAGMSLEEAFAVIRGSAWNKFAGRRNEEEQLRRELAKVVENQFKEKPKGADRRHMKSDEEEARGEKEPYSQLRFESMDEIEETELDYVWYPYLARGEVTIIEGDPGLGKSYLAMMIAGSIATGRRLITPRKGMPKTLGSVCYFDMENAASYVTKPRLRDNGFTDFSGRYHVIQQGFSVDDDEAMEEVYDALEEIKPALVVFDTLNSYIGKADTHKASEVQQAFNNFTAIARDFNCSVVVLRHLTKGTGSAMYRGQGSIAFAGAARIVLAVGVDPEDTETRAMAVTKINMAKPPQALTFRIEERPKNRSEFVWGEYANLSSQEILDAAAQARAEGKQGKGIQDAMEFLEATITGAPHEVEKLYRMGEKRSISRKMIDRAAQKMNLVKGKRKINGTRVETWEIERD